MTSVARGLVEIGQAVEPRRAFRSLSAGRDQSRWETQCHSFILNVRLTSLWFRFGRQARRARTLSSASATSSRSAITRGVSSIRTPARPRIGSKKDDAASAARDWQRAAKARCVARRGRHGLRQAAHPGRRGVQIHGGQIHGIDYIYTINRLDE